MTTLSIVLDKSKMAKAARELQKQIKLTLLAWSLTKNGFKAFMARCLINLIVLLSLRCVLKVKKKLF